MTQNDTLAVVLDGTKVSVDNDSAYPKLTFHGITVTHFEGTIFTEDFYEFICEEGLNANVLMYLIETEMRKQQIARVFANCVV